MAKKKHNHQILLAIFSNAHSSYLNQVLKLGI